jgi:hypothetical protein
MLFEFESFVLVYVISVYEFMIISQVCSCQIAYKRIKNSSQNEVEF